MSESVEEYEAQLVDVLKLLDDSPTDESLLSLKSDLEELIAITKQNQYAAEETSHQEPKLSVAAAMDAAADRALATAIGETDMETSKRKADDLVSPVEVGATKKNSKKSTISKEFDVPPKLVVLDTDTEAEKSRKYRAIKSLKTKWRAQKKELESEQKQKSWQSFQKKKKVVKDKSMFSTTDGDAKVGVVAVYGRQLTNAGERKRHKHL
jgi:survival-of-motor-neuron-related-splicing factor 30